MTLTGRYWHSLRRTRVNWWPLVVGVMVVLFPFDWLSEAWPAFGAVFDQVFVTARDHAIGHSTLFFLLGMLALLSLARLRLHPLLYTALLVPLALGQEALQGIFKQEAPRLGDARDLFFDLVGWSLALGLIWLWYGVRGRAARSVG